MPDDEDEQIGFTAATESNGAAVVSPSCAQPKQDQVVIDANSCQTSPRCEGGGVAPDKGE